MCTLEYIGQNRNDLFIVFVFLKYINYQHGLYRVDTSVLWR